MTDASRYPAQVFWSDEDGGYIAIASDLPGSSAFGLTQQEALAQLQHAIAVWIEATSAAGNPVPPPSQPAAIAEHSGKFALRMPRTLHSDLARTAESDGVSLNLFIVAELSAANARRYAKERSLQTESSGAKLSRLTDRILNLAASSASAVSVSTVEFGDAMDVRGDRPAHAVVTASSSRPS